MKQVILYIFIFLFTPGIYDQVKGSDEIWNQLNKQVATAYRAGKYQEGIDIAEKAFQYTMAQFGKEHPDTLVSMNNLAFLYQSQGRYAEAEPLYQQALQLREKVLGKEHPDTITSVNNLAVLYESQGRYAEAEPLYQQALQLREKVLGKEHPEYHYFREQPGVFVPIPGPVCRSRAAVSAGIATS